MNRSASHAQLRSQPHWISMIAVLVSSSIAQIDWIIETPDGPRQFAHRSDRSLAVDAFGRPHMAYGEDGLYYAWSDGASWHIEVVDSTPQVGAWAAIALDAFGRPHISYADSDRNVLRHAYGGPAGWSIETADTTNGVGRYTSIAVDGQNRPHISYLDHANALLRYARRDADGWQIEIPDTSRGGGSGSSIALGPGGFPCISFFASDSLMTELKYAFADELGWHVEAIDTAGFSNTAGDSRYTSLALNSEGEPHIGYTRWEADEVWHACMLDTGWSVERVDEGYYASIALGAGDQPFIAYCGGYAADEALKLARLDMSGWSFSFVDTTGWEPAVAVQEGSVHIAYRTARELRYAREDQAVWRVDVVDREAKVGSYTSLALDACGSPHISYYDYSNYDLKYCYRDPSGWHAGTLESDGMVGWYTSLALDSEDSPRIGYQDFSDGQIKYARKNGAGWDLHIVDDLIYQQPGRISLALDAEGFPHLSYYYICGGANMRVLKYARLSTAGWLTEIVEGGGWYSAIAIDGGGSPRISHRTEDGLVYLRRPSSQWVRQVVDPVNVGFISLALDAQESPHVSYCEFTGDAAMDINLKYAFHDGSVWHIELVDTAGWVGYYTSLSLDSRGNPHISYQDHGQQDLKYAFRDESGWHIQTVASEGDVGSYASLALDSNDVPYISYTDYSRNDLKMARGSGSTSADGSYFSVAPPPLRITGVWPNPIDSDVRFRYTLTRDLHRLTAQIYDLSGRAVVTLMDRAGGPGAYCDAWDLLDCHGKPVCAGPYFLVIATPGSDEKAVARVVVVR